MPFRYVLGCYNGKSVFLVLPFWEALATVAELGVLIAVGGRIFVVVEEAGALSSRLRIGDILVPTWGRNIRL